MEGIRVDPASIEEASAARSEKHIATDT